MKPGEDDTKREKFMIYLRGWSHGASVRAMDPRFTEHPKEEFRLIYEQAYTDGKDARTLAGVKYAEAISYDPSMSILRQTCPEESLSTRTVVRQPRIDQAFEEFPMNGLICVECGKVQRDTPGGPSCENGHGGAEGRKPQL